MMPSYFIAHGAPLLALEDTQYTQFLNQLGQTLPTPEAIILFSAHWESPTQKVSDVDEFSTIYDFGGFPEALYQITYPAKGKQELTKQIIKLLTDNKIPYEVDQNRGLDHGAWVVLRMLYPNANIPVISMSVNPRLSPEEQYKIGQSLSVLREKNVMIIGSGGTVHNLRALKWEDREGQFDQWAVDFEEWIGAKLENWDIDSLFKYDTLAPNASLAVPPYGNEHFVPIFYAMGAADGRKSAKLLHRSFRYGNLSHSVWEFGGK